MELSIVRIGLETTRVTENETQIANCRWGRYFGIWIYITLGALVLEPFSIYYLRMCLPIALHRKLSWHDDPMTLRSRYCAPLLIKPIDLVARKHCAAFRTLGLRVPKRLRPPTHIVRFDIAAGAQPSAILIRSAGHAPNALREAEEAILSEAVSQSFERRGCVDRCAEREANRQFREHTSLWTPETTRVHRVNSQWQAPTYHTPLLAAVAAVIFLDPALRSFVVTQCTLMVSLYLSSLQQRAPSTVRNLVVRFNEEVPGSVGVLLSWLAVVCAILGLTLFAKLTTAVDTFAHELQTRTGKHRIRRNHHLKHPLSREDSDSSGDDDDDDDDHTGHTLVYDDITHDKAMANLDPCDAGNGELAVTGAVADATIRCNTLSISFSASVSLAEPASPRRLRLRPSLVDESDAFRALFPEPTQGEVVEKETN